MNRKGKPLLCVVGTRPNFIKMAPLIRAFDSRGIDRRLVHTGQHYDHEMDARFFCELGLPHPEVNLGVGSGSHAKQTAEIMEKVDSLIDPEEIDAVLVVGDVNSSLACALVAAKKGVGVIHVEAGLRSFDRSMPEEVNRVLIDQISDVLFATERDAVENLKREGIPSERVYFVGNVMIDSLCYHLSSAVHISEIAIRYGIERRLSHNKEYVLFTLHRPANVDNPQRLSSLVSTIEKIGETYPVIFPTHPRTRENLQRFYPDALRADSRIITIPPVGYLEMLGLLKDAKMVLTDSGGIQEETTALGVPCLTLRENTERPVTVSEGTNRLVGVDPSRILEAAKQALAVVPCERKMPELWDGKSALRIADILLSLRNRQR